MAVKDMDGRLRDLEIRRGVLRFPEGSCEIRMGDTIVLATASVEEKVPPFLEGRGVGWVTAEYAMLPRANRSRKRRDITGLKLDGRSQEIQRLIGRSLRACVDRELLGERTITIDCDVLQGDGGTRTASINAGFLALAEACSWLVEQGLVRKNPIKFHIGAVSVGKVKDRLVLDLCYAEDSRAIVDLNVVMNEFGDFVEVQGTGEESVFSRSDLEGLLDLASEGIVEIIERQRGVLGEDRSGDV